MRRLVAALLLLWGAAVWADTTTRFRPVDVVIDPHGERLAAYQIEIITQGVAEIVGVEGGAHPAFAEAPYYDPAALGLGRIIVAAFSTDSNVPTTVTRVATLHMRETDTTGVEYEVKLITAANDTGRRIDALVSVRRQEGESE